jgi:hypothetical protein
MRLVEWGAGFAENIREQCVSFLKNCLFGIIIAAMITHYLFENLTLDLTYSKFAIF